LSTKIVAILQSCVAALAAAATDLGGLREGYVGSTGLVEVIAFLEETFGVTITV
jgi:acyl carrier protein